MTASRDERADIAPHGGAVVRGGVDLGLFGPGSVSWRVMADPVFAIGGLRALFLQALHPRAMAGWRRTPT